jgi:hypothetical protein
MRASAPSAPQRWSIRADLPSLRGGFGRHGDHRRQARSLPAERRQGGPCRRWSEKTPSREGLAMGDRDELDEPDLKDGPGPRPMRASRLGRQSW